MVRLQKSNSLNNFHEKYSLSSFSHSELNRLTIRYTRIVCSLPPYHCIVKGVYSNVIGSF